MVRKSTDEVLADLERVGAVGAPPEPVGASVPVVTKVTLDRGAPTVELRDLRGEKACEAIDQARAWLQEAQKALEAASSALGRLRGVWEPVEVEGEQDDVPELVVDEEQSPPVPELLSIQGGAERVAEEEAYRQAREAALRKIRGEDEQAGQDDEEDVPFVGQVRARPESLDTGEVSLGTLGMVKPGMPVEG